MDAEYFEGPCYGAIGATWRREGGRRWKTRMRGAAMGVAVAGEREVQVPFAVSESGFAAASNMVCVGRDSYGPVCHICLRSRVWQVPGTVTWHSRTLEAITLKILISVRLLSICPIL